MIYEEEFKDYIENLDSSPPMIEPRKVDSIIKTMNRKAATVEGDIPMKLIAEFSVELAFPLSHIINFCLDSGVYPNMRKLEHVTPFPKCFSP